MGSWLTRTRAWVYIAFYDEYVGRHINTSAGLSILFFIPMYLWGLKINRIVEHNANHAYYHMQYFDKRSRLTHNLIMEHFEMHVEKTQDLMIELREKGPATFEGLEVEKKSEGDLVDTFALIDEMSGLTNYLENFMMTHNVSETQRARIRAHTLDYTGKLDKAQVKQNLYITMFGDQR